MLQEIIKLLNKLNNEELIQLKDVVTKKMEANAANAAKSGNDGAHKRTNKRINVVIPGSCVIAREKEFFYKEHRINILDLSSSGIRFKIDIEVYKNDIVNVSFRSPVTGENKFIDCHAIRVVETKDKGKLVYEVAAKAISKEELKAYRETLRKR